MRSFGSAASLKAATSQRKTALSASIAKNNPPKDQPNSRVVARSFMDQQRHGGIIVQSIFVCLKGTNDVRRRFWITNFRWEEGLFGPIEAATEFDAASYFARSPRCNIRIAHNGR